MGDCSSSSDDEPMIRSPSVAGSENDDGDDIFHYQKRTFVKTDVTNGYSSPLPSARRKRSKKLSTDDQISGLERKRKVKAKKLQGRLSRQDSQSDSDDDPSIVEIVDDFKATASSSNNDDSSIEILPSPFCPSKNVAASIQLKGRASLPLGLHDSSDDESPKAISQVPLSTFKGASKASMDVLQRSKQAKLQLKKAQHYHADDIHVDIQDLETQSAVTETRKRIAPSSMQRQPIDFGNALRLNCRVQLEVNGKKKERYQKVFTLRENEQFQVLLSKFLKENALPAGARINMLFDGLALDTLRTPSSYDMMDEDLIDIMGKVNVIPSSIQTKTTEHSVGPKMSIKLRRKVDKGMEETSVHVGCRESFQCILDSYKSRQELGEKRIILRFDGESIKLSKTPGEYDMESGDLIDVICD